MTVRDIMNARRTAELEVQCLQRQIESASWGSGLISGMKTSWPSRVKVPGKGNGYSFKLGHSNPPSEEYYVEMLKKIMRDKQSLVSAAEWIIESLPPDRGNARVILRYYYCQAMSDSKVANRLSQDGYEYDPSSVCRMRLSALDWLSAHLGDMELDATIVID